MPYLDVEAAVLQRAFALDDRELPDAAILVGQWSQRRYFERVRRTWPDARLVEDHTLLVDEAGMRIWISIVLGAAMAASFAHLVAKLGARAIVQAGTMGGLAAGWSVGDVLVPSLVVGRDGVSRQLSRNRPLEPDPALASALCAAIAAELAADDIGDRAGVGAGVAAAAVRPTVRTGSLVTTTTISFERTADIGRWRRAGFGGVEMECAATLAVGRHFGLPAAGAFVLQDNIGVGHTVFDPSEEDRRRLRTGKDAVLRGAVAALRRAVE